ncbi:MAG: ATP-binding cassette domain-containing protein, partial [Chitinophagaceae bacterium]
MAIISVKDLRKNYGQFEAVKGISFDVEEGEIFGLLGPNGAGKSTTLEIIETLREKTSGQITVNGFDLDKEPNEIKKIIGVQLQASGTGIFSWTPGVNIVNANTATPTVNPTNTTIYHVQLNEQGCINEDSVQVRVVRFVTLNSMPDSTICLTDQAQLRLNTNG